MGESLDPKYNPQPLEPDNTGGDNEAPDPDNGKDLNYLVPHVGMMWDAPTSFNQDPWSNGGGSGTVPNTPTSDLYHPFNVDLASLRNSEVSMLNALRTDVNQYESLRATVESAVSNPTMYGPAYQEPTEPLVVKDGGSASLPVHGGWTAEMENSNKIAEQGQQFAAAINPVMEKTLKAIADVLGLSGTFVAMLNSAGQTYSQTDRKAKFPDPPEGSPVT